RDAAGAAVFSNPSSLAPKSSGTTVVIPVTLPPGCARFGTRPIATGSAIPTNTIGIVGAASRTAGVLRRGDDNDLGAKRHKLAHERGQAIELALRVPNLDLKVAPHIVSPCAELVAKRLFHLGIRHTRQHGYSMYRLLRWSFMCKRDQTSRNSGEHTKRSHVSVEREQVGESGCQLGKAHPCLGFQTRERFPASHVLLPLRITPE